MNWMKMRFCLPVIYAAFVAAPLTGMGQSLNDVIGVEQDRIKLAQASQGRIDEVVDGTRKMEGQYKALLKEIEGLRIYNELLQRQIQRQLAQMQDLNDSIDRVEIVSRQIAPLMFRMIESMKQFVDLDVPFLLDERRTRVAGLETMMERQDVAVSEKFRKVMEAYQIENDYGRTIEAYKGTLPTTDGGAIEVDFLRVGRIALLYQTADGKLSGAWDHKNGQWVEVNGYRNSIRQGLKIAKKQIAPDLVLLPVPTPEAG